MKNLFNYIKLYPSFFNWKIFSEGAFFSAWGHTRAPFSVNFQITDKCNLKCKACSFFGSGERSSSCANEADLESIRNFLLSISKYKPVVSFGGGEPFARGDFLEILKTAKKECGLKTIVITNGTLLGDETINIISGSKLTDYLVISLYNLYEKHDEIVGVKGAFEKTLGNIRKLVKLRGVELIVSTVLMEENARDLERFAGFFLNEGVKKIKIEHQNFITEKEHEAFNGSAVFCPGTFIKKGRFDEQFIKEAWDVLGRIRKAYPSVFVKPPLSRKEFYGWYGADPAAAGKCHFIKHSFFISPRGQIIPCQYFNNCVLGQIGRDDPIRLWNSMNYRKAREIIERGSFAMCSRCCK